MQKAAEGAQDVAIKVKRGTIRGRGGNQQRYLHEIATHDINFGVGPAGTGKTYLAVAMAVDALDDNRVQRLVLVRPAVEAGEKLGFLPGDLTQKVDPYLRPLYDALYEMLGIEKVMKLIERNVIEIAPLAYMRGRTLNDSFVILDEAQNTTIEQMKMFLTRIGFGSVAVVTGDMTQTDLPRQVKSGLRDAIEVLRDVEGVSIHVLHCADVVRHPLVQRIVRAYEKRDEGMDAPPSDERAASTSPVRRQSRRPQRRADPRASFESWYAPRCTAGTRARREINIALFEEAEARAPQPQYRGKDHATNVLSFPYEPLPGEKSALLGDLALCPAVIAREARQQSKTPARSLCAPDHPRRAAPARSRPSDQRRRRKNGNDRATRARGLRHRRSLFRMTPIRRPGQAKTQRPRTDAEGNRHGTRLSPGGMTVFTAPTHCRLRKIFRNTAFDKLPPRPCRAFATRQ